MGFAINAYQVHCCSMSPQGLYVTPTHRAGGGGAITCDPVPPVTVVKDQRGRFFKIRKVAREMSETSAVGRYQQRVTTERSIDRVTTEIMYHPGRKYDLLTVVWNSDISLSSRIITHISVQSGSSYTAAVLHYRQQQQC